MDNLLNIAQHFEVYMNDFVNQYGTLFYLVAFLIIWMETGLIVLTAFLPGETLLFAAGATAALPGNKLHIISLLIIFFLAALLGDSTNYLIGKTIGRNLLETKIGKRLVKPSQLQNTEEFYEKYGPVAIILGRYIPFVRSIVPFVAAASKFSFWHFFKFSIIGTAAWAITMTMVGYLFGNIPFIKQNFTLIILGIVLFSLAPSIITAYRNYIKRKKN